MAIEISDTAINEVRRMMQKEGVQAGGLRVGVKGGGCSGLSYNLSFETQTRTGDKVFEREGVKLFCDLKSYIYLNARERKFHELSRQCHPDYYTTAADAEKHKALRMTALLNDAYRTLRNPGRRVEYLL